MASHIFQLPVSNSMKAFILVYSISSYLLKDKPKGHNLNKAKHKTTPDKTKDTNLNKRQAKVQKQIS